MLRSILPALLALIFVLLVTSGCGRSDFLHASAEFDQAYVPALLHSSQGRGEEAAQAMERLNEAWVRMDEEYRDFDREVDWGATFNQVENQLRLANGYLDDGQLLRAHEALEPIRGALSDLRRARGMDYYLDYLTAFHLSMQHVYRTVDGETPASLGAEQVGRVMNFYPSLLEDWRDVLNARPDPNLFDLNGEELDLLDTRLREQTRVVEALGRALEQSDDAAIIENGTALRSGSIEIFRLFGDFD